MKIAKRVAALLIAGAAGCSSSPHVPDADGTGGRQIAAPDPAVAAQIGAYRARGAQGLTDVFCDNALAIAQLRAGTVALDAPEVLALRRLIDGVAGQRDAYASGLFWYTDLEAAKAEAARTGRHILSLRLLGNLDEEYSCANSRYFRTVLYANEAVSKHLRSTYVLHWKSVRPAPLVTIDMGDGRRLKRTVTGNSIHYVLDPQGNVLDAIPGMYGPAAFLSELEQSEKLRADLKPAGLRAWHGGRANWLCRQWLSDAATCGIYSKEFISHLKRGTGDAQRWLDEAFPQRKVPDGPLSVVGKLYEWPTLKGPPEFRNFAAVKSMVERPISRATSPAARDTPVSPDSTSSGSTASPDGASTQPAADQRPLVDRMTGDAWQKVGLLHLEEARLDESSRRMMMAKLPRTAVTVAERRAGGVVRDDTAFARTLSRFEAAIAMDTAHNAYLFHTQIHQWLEEDTTDRLRRDVEALNRRVYRELYLTPDFDVWLGLVPEDTYTAIEADGCACDPGARPMR